MTILEGSSFSVAPPTPAVEKRGGKIYFFFKFHVERKQFCSIKVAPLLHFNEPKHNRITERKRVCFFISMTACKHKWKLSLNSSKGTGHCSDQEVPLDHGQNGFTAELFVLLPQQWFNFHVNIL